MTKFWWVYLHSIREIRGYLKSRSFDYAALSDDKSLRIFSLSGSCEEIARGDLLPDVFRDRQRQLLLGCLGDLLRCT